MLTLFHRLSVDCVDCVDCMYFLGVVCFCFFLIQDDLLFLNAKPMCYLSDE